MTVSAIVLAGGRSRRLGREKSIELISGRSLMERVLERVRPLAAETILVYSPAQREQKSYPGTRAAVDLYPGKSSLGGIYTGLMTSTCYYNLAVACDMPFLSVPLLRYMIGLCSDYDVIIPRIDDKIEPLHAIYAKTCLEPIERQLRAGDLRVVNFISPLNVRYVDQDELDRFDPEHLSFFNINTEADLTRARQLASSEADQEEARRRPAAR